MCEVSCILQNNNGYFIHSPYNGLSAYSQSLKVVLIQRESVRVDDGSEPSGEYWLHYCIIIVIIIIKKAEITPKMHITWHHHHHYYYKGGDKFEKYTHS